MDTINSIKSPSLPPHELVLKKGAVVMLLRNLDLSAGQCNGTRMRIIAMEMHHLEVEILTGSHKPKIKLKARDVALPNPLSRFQFPVRVSFAMTIIKAQGQTFDNVGIYLQQPCFTHGQLYVAFSRVRRYEDLYVCIVNSSKQGCFSYKNGRKFTRNVIYKSVISMSELTLNSEQVE